MPEHKIGDILLKRYSTSKTIKGRAVKIIGIVSDPGAYKDTYEIIDTRGHRETIRDYYLETVSNRLYNYRIRLDSLHRKQEILNKRVESANIALQRATEETRKIDKYFAKI